MARSAFKTTDEAGITTRHDLPAGEVTGELTPELLGVGYIIAEDCGITFAGGVLAYLVIVPLIKMFATILPAAIYPAVTKIVAVDGGQIDKGLIRNMDPDDIRDKYILYIGAGAVAAGGILSMLQALPMIFSSIISGLRDLRSSKSEDPAVKMPKKLREPNATCRFGL